MRGGAPSGNKTRGSPEMTRRRRRFTGSLLKKIDPDDAPALGLRAAFALPPSEEDIAAHIQSEEKARWIALDKHFGLDSTAPDIAERRAKLLIAFDTGTDVAFATKGTARLARGLTSST